MLFVGVFSAPAISREKPATWDRASLGLLVANGVLDAANMTLFFAAYTHTSVAVAVLTHYLTPVIVALAAPRIDGAVTPNARVAALIATVGLALVLEPWRDPPSGLWLGAALGCASAVCYAGNVFVVRRLGNRIGAARAISLHAFIAALVLAPFALGGLGAVTGRDLAILGAGSLVLGAFAGIAFIAGLTRIGSARAAVLTFCEPLVAVLAAWAAFGETPSAWAALGGAMVIGAGVLVVTGAGGEARGREREARAAGAPPRRSGEMYNEPR